MSLTDMTNGRLKHGMCGTKVYRAWVAMRHRCQSPKHPSWVDYGGRGIEVCERWQSFRNFYIDMGDPPAGMSIDRIDNDGNYEPGNCRWATPKEQSQNTRSNVHITDGGVTKTVMEWSRAKGIPFDTIRTRNAQGIRPPELWSKRLYRRLTEQDVIQVRGLIGDGIAVKDVALQFSISESLVHAIVRRRVWRHVA